MGLKRFEEYSGNTPKQESPKVEKKKVLKTKKVNESSFLVGQDYKVKSTFDVSQDLVQQYIEKVEQETGRSPLDNFNEAEIAEQMVDYVVKQNLVIDNLPSDFTVGSESTSDLENAEAQASADSDQLSSDMGEDTPDEEIDFNVEGSEETGEEQGDDNETGDIEFGMEETDMDEEIEVGSDELETEDEAEAESESEAESETEEDGSDFEEIEFDDSETEGGTDGEKETSNKPKTVGDYLNKTKSKGEKDEKEEEETEEEETAKKKYNSIEDLYKKVGYKADSYYESLDYSNIFNPLRR